MCWTTLYSGSLESNRPIHPLNSPFLRRVTNAPLLVFTLRDRGVVSIAGICLSFMYCSIVLRAIQSNFLLSFSLSPLLDFSLLSFSEKTIAQYPTTLFLSPTSESPEFLCSMRLTAMLGLFSVMYRSVSTHDQPHIVVTRFGTFFCSLLRVTSIKFAA